MRIEGAYEEQFNTPSSESAPKKLYDPNSSNAASCFVLSTVFKLINEETVFLLCRHIY